MPGAGNVNMRMDSTINRFREREMLSQDTMNTLMRVFVTIAISVSVLQYISRPGVLMPGVPGVSLPEA